MGNDCTGEIVLKSYGRDIREQIRQIGERVFRSRETKLTMEVTGGILLVESIMIIKNLEKLHTRFIGKRGG